MDSDTVDLIKTIIWLAIFIFWVGFQFFKKLIGAMKKDAAPQLPKNKKQPAQGKKVTSARDSLLDFFKKIANMQKAEESGFPPPKKPAVPHKKQPQPPPLAAEPEKQAVSTPKPQPVQVSADIRPEMSAEGFRYAVIFSEILAPPLALQDRDDRQF